MPVFLNSLIPGWTSQCQWGYYRRRSLSTGRHRGYWINTSSSSHARADESPRTFHLGPSCFATIGTLPLLAFHLGMSFRSSFFFFFFWALLLICPAIMCMSFRNLWDQRPSERPQFIGHVRGQHLWNQRNDAIVPRERSRVKWKAQDGWNQGVRPVNGPHSIMPSCQNIHDLVAIQFFFSDNIGHKGWTDEEVGFRCNSKIMFAEVSFQEKTAITPKRPTEENVQAIKVHNVAWLDSLQNV